LVEYENLDTQGTGPGGLDALVAACQGLPYNNMAPGEVGLKAVAAIDAMYRSALSGKAEDCRYE
jgi:hypothetical protein